MWHLSLKKTWHLHVEVDMEDLQFMSYYGGKDGGLPEIEGEVLTPGVMSLAPNTQGGLR